MNRLAGTQLGLLPLSGRYRYLSFSNPSGTGSKACRRLAYRRSAAPQVGRTRRPQGYTTGSGNGWRGHDAWIRFQTKAPPTLLSETAFTRCNAAPLVAFFEEAFPGANLRQDSVAFCAPSAQPEGGGRWYLESRDGTRYFRTWSAR